MQRTLNKLAELASLASAQQAKQGAGGNTATSGQHNRGVSSSACATDRGAQSISVSGQAAPSAFTAIPAAKSRYSLPVASYIRAPSPRVNTMLGRTYVCMMYLSADSSRLAASHVIGRLDT